MNISSCKRVAFLIGTLAVVSSANIILTEINYNPQSDGTVDGDEYEFIELKNTSSSPFALDGCSFTNGITYSFAAGAKIEPGAFIVLAFNQQRFKERYGFDPFGIFTGHLSNSGEKITLKDTVNNLTLVSADYKTTTPWPIAADAGFSLVAVKTDGSGDPDDPSYWRASSSLGGSPGKEDTANTASSQIVINEILSNTNDTQKDAIELFNVTDKAVNIGGWYLTDNKNKPFKYKIPDGTTIEPSGFLVFDADDFDVLPTDTNSFSFGAHGDGAFIFATDNTGKLTGYCHGFDFGEIYKGLSFGRYINSAGKEQLVILQSVTLGSKNSVPLPGQIVITEINYSAKDNANYIVIKNIGATSCKLFDTLNPGNTWKINGLGFTFPQSVSLNAGESAYIVSNTTTEAIFRKNHTAVSPTTKLFIFSASLSPKGETITIQRPGLPYTDSKDSLIVPYLDVDAVDFNDNVPWPTCGKDSSLIKIDPLSYGNDPTAWKSGPGSAGPSAVIYLNRSALKSVVSSFAFDNNSGLVSFTLAKDANLKIGMYDLNGKTIYSYTKGLKCGKHTIATRLQNNADGVHLIRILAGRENTCLKINSTN